jgi:hypothetical protein
VLCVWRCIEGHKYSLNSHKSRASHEFHLPSSAAAGR